MADAFFQHLATECACFPATGGPILHTSKAPNFLSLLSSWFMRLLLLVFTSLSLLAASCTKDEYDPLDELPPATQEGRNKMGCLINGVPWKNRGGSVSDPSIKGNYGSMPPGVSVVAFDNEPQDASTLYEVFVIKVDPLVEGLIPIQQYSAEYERVNANNPELYRLDTLSPALIEITRHDSSNRILAGFFNFVLINIDGKERLEITDGRFDVIYD